MGKKNMGADKHTVRFAAIAGFGALLAAGLVLYLFVHHRMDNVLDSDIATQLVLSKMLQEEGGILSENWHYATELRILGYNLFFAPLFHFISNWRIVRTVGSMAAFAALLLSIGYFCVQAHMPQYFFALGTLFLLPFSEQYYSFVLKNINYVPFLILSFLSLGLLFSCYRSKTRRTMGARLLLLLLLAFLSGMGGSRQMYITYAPAVLAALCFPLVCKNRMQIKTVRDLLHTEYFRFMKTACLAAVSNAAGYGVNSFYLAEKYHFYDYETVRWNPFSIAKCGEVLGGVFTNLGFSTDPLFSAGALHSLCSLLVFGLFVYACCRILKQAGEYDFAHGMLVLFVASACLISVFLYGFTTMAYAPRYDLLWAVFCFPVIAACLCRKQALGRHRKAVICGFAVLVGLCCLDSYHTYFTMDTTSELRKISQLLCENGYREGYATFWNANIMTELSDGRLEVWDWMDGSQDFATVDQTYQWAAPLSHDTEHPKGRVFWILTREQEKNFHFPKSVGEGHVLYRTPEDINDSVWDEKDKRMQYAVYGFSSYDEMYALTSNVWDGEHSINPGRMAKSAETNLYPGTYFFFCIGEGLQEVAPACRYHRVVQKKKKTVVEEKTTEIVLEQVGAAEAYLCFTFTLEEEAENLFVEYRNNSREAGAYIQYAQIMKNGAWYADFYDSVYVRNGYDEQGMRYLSKGGESFGPFLTLVPGTYTVTCQGSGLDGLVFDSTYYKDGSMYALHKTNVVQEEKRICYDICIEEVVENFEARFFLAAGQNKNQAADQTAALYGLRIKRK